MACLTMWTRSSSSARGALTPSSYTAIAALAGVSTPCASAHRSERQRKPDSTSTLWEGQEFEGEPPQRGGKGAGPHIAASGKQTAHDGHLERRRSRPDGGSRRLRARYRGRREGATHPAPDHQGPHHRVPSPTGGANSRARRSADSVAEAIWAEFRRPTAKTRGPLAPRCAGSSRSAWLECPDRVPAAGRGARSRRLRSGTTARPRQPTL